MRVDFLTDVAGTDDALFRLPGDERGVVYGVVCSDLPGVFAGGTEIAFGNQQSEPSSGIYEAALYGGAASAGAGPSRTLFGVLLVPSVPQCAGKESGGVSEYSASGAGGEGAARDGKIHIRHRIFLRISGQQLLFIPLFAAFRLFSAGVPQNVFGGAAGPPALRMRKSRRHFRGAAFLRRIRKDGILPGPRILLQEPGDPILSNLLRGTGSLAGQVLSSFDPPRRSCF